MKALASCPKILGRLGRVLRLQGVHSDEADSVTLAVKPNPNGILVDDLLDMGGYRIELSPGDQAPLSLLHSGSCVVTSKTRDYLVDKPTLP